MTPIELVREQAEDDGLWFEAATAPEAYLQQELRRLHAVIESATTVPEIAKEPYPVHITGAAPMPIGETRTFMAKATTANFTGCAGVMAAPPIDTRAKALEEADKRFIRQLPDGLVMASADLLKEIRYRMEHKEDCGPQRLPDGDCYCGHISLAKAIDAAITGKDTP